MPTKTPDASGGATVPDASEHAAADASAADGGQASANVDCDPRKILCKRAVPQCPEGQLPSVSESCYGDCVPFERCACDEAADCPDENQYTCHMYAKHCGPYVE